MRGWQGGGEASADAWLVLRTGGASLICILGDNPSLRAAVRFIALAGGGR